MSRGNRGCVIYEDDADREMFLETLSQGCSKTGWVVHAYVLMGTHFHFLTIPKLKKKVLKALADV